MRQEDYDAWCAEVDLADLGRLEELHVFFDNHKYWKRNLYAGKLFRRINSRIAALRTRDMFNKLSRAPLRPQPLLMSQQDYDDIVKWSSEDEG